MVQAPRAGSDELVARLAVCRFVQVRGSHRIERRASVTARNVQAAITISGPAAWPQVSANVERRVAGAWPVEAEPADAHEV